MWRNGALYWPLRRVETALGEGFYFLRIFYPTTLSLWMSDKNFDVICYICYVKFTLFTHWHCTLFLCRKHQQGEAVESRNGSWRRSAAFFKMIYILSKMWDTMSFYIHISFHVCWCVNLFQVQKVQNRRARNLQRGQNLGIIHDKNVWHWFSLFSCIVSQLNGREEFLYTFEGNFEFTLLNLDSRPL